MRDRDGLTLLETMVALVILSLVVLATIQLLGGTIRTAQNAASWSQAVSYAEGGMELAKLDLTETLARGTETLEGGFTRTVSARSWSTRLKAVDVAVALPDGRRFVVSRLMEAP